MSAAAWLEPETLTDALALLRLPGARPVAGGMELMLAQHLGLAAPSVYVSLIKVPGLDRFLAHPKIGLQIGAGVRLRTVESDVWVAKRWAALHEAVEQIAPPQVHNMGTVVGNLCAGNALYDLAVALAAHRAHLVIRSVAGTRDIAITDFYHSDGSTVLEAGELVVQLTAPRPSPDAGSAFRKIARRPLGPSEPAKLSAAAYVVLDLETETLREVAIAVGTGGAPQRLHEIEAGLLGAPALTASYMAAAEAAAATLAATGTEWVDAVLKRWMIVLVRDVLEQAASRGRSRHDPFDDASAMIEGSQ